MKIILIALLSLHSTITSANINPSEAKTFLKSMKCQFSAFLTNTKGQVASIAICAESMREGTAKGHKFCVVRGADMHEGVYTSDPTRGDLRRFEGSYCSKEAISKILNTNYYKNELRGATKFIRGSWTIVDDKHGVSPTFNSVISPKN